jgi:hypothetical protein
MGLQLIGAGLGRTGTLSLKLALEQLGFGPCYHMVEALMNPAHAPLWIGAADGQPQWDTLFGGYLSSVDYPGCMFWRELARHYPQAKVLLSVRDPDQWFQSTQETIFAEQHLAELEASPLRAFAQGIVAAGIREHIHERDFMVEYFLKHNEAVKCEIAPERLLVYEVGQGWEPLCRFLGVPVPERAFPRANTREEFAKRSAARGPNSRQDPEALAKMVRAGLAQIREQS